jgi:hypothetical protein
LTVSIKSTDSFIEEIGKGEISFPESNVTCRNSYLLLSDWLRWKQPRPVSKKRQKKERCMTTDVFATRQKTHIDKLSVWLSAVFPQLVICGTFGMVRYLDFQLILKKKKRILTWWHP